MKRAHGMDGLARIQQARHEQSTGHSRYGHQRASMVVSTRPLSARERTCCTTLVERESNHHTVCRPVAATHPEPDLRIGGVARGGKDVVGVPHVRDVPVRAVVGDLALDGWLGEVVAACQPAEARSTRDVRQIDPRRTQRERARVRGVGGWGGGWSGSACEYKYIHFKERWTTPGTSSSLPERTV